MDIRQPTRTAMKYVNGTFDNLVDSDWVDVVEHDWVEEAPESTSEASAGMLAEIDNFENEQRISGLSISLQRGFKCVYSDPSRTAAIASVAAYFEVQHTLA